MTGVRIAATLGCFFAFMVFLIAYKSRNKDDGMNVSRRRAYAWDVTLRFHFL